MALPPLVVDELLGGTLEPGVVAPLMIAEQSLHQVAARHNSNLVGNYDTNHTSAEYNSAAPDSGHPRPACRGEPLNPPGHDIEPARLQTVDARP